MSKSACLPVPPICTVVSLVCIVCMLSVAPVSATIVLSDVSCTPNPPLVPGQSQHVAADFVIIPSGATTFEKGHEIQMTTSLENALWNIQVIVDGVPAARQNAAGTAAFVNGALLSYPTSRDVSMTVTIDGTVPAAPGPSVQLLQAEELDNSGHIVPGSVITITQPAAGTPGTVTTPIPARTSEITTVSSTPTRSPGFLPLLTILAVSIVAAGCCILQRKVR